MSSPPDTHSLVEFLRDSGLSGPAENPRFTRLTGGVSSDIWKVDLSSGAICLKRALPKLNVADDWFAPVERNAYEVAWYRTVAEISPGAVPDVLAEDQTLGVFAMSFLDNEKSRLWKDELSAGTADEKFAARCGDVLGRIHGATADRPDIAETFSTDDIFYAIRLEPYLAATAERHPDVSASLLNLVETTAATRQALVHGDVSPKNIMVTETGPVFLDAECAWYGDPAFDVAFCLNHFLLKCLWVAPTAPAYLKCFDAIAEAYLAALPARMRTNVNSRAAHLLPGLFLARIDGKSPVEYITHETDKNRVRRVAKSLLLKPVESVHSIREAWARELGLEN